MTKIEKNKNILEDHNARFLKLSEEIFKAGNNTAHRLDLYILSIINRTISLNKAFILLLDNENSFTAISIVRLQLDNALRLNAVNTAEDPNHFLDYFFAEKPINKYKQGKDTFTDNFLASKLDEDVPGAIDLYKYLCDFVHFSGKHFNMTQSKPLSENGLFRMTIGNSDVLKEEEKLEFYDRMIKISNSIARISHNWVEVKNSMN